MQNTPRKWSLQRLEKQNWTFPISKTRQANKLTYIVWATDRQTAEHGSGHTTLKEELKGSTRSTHSSEEETRPLCAVMPIHRWATQVILEDPRHKVHPGKSILRVDWFSLKVWNGVLITVDITYKSLSLQKNGKIAWFKGRKIYQKKKSIKQSMASIFSLI